MAALISERIRQRLLDWYRSHRRDLPWRQTADPYAVLVSEVMLQQTQVATVIPYFCRWMDRFPSFKALADADEEDVLAQWQGLGYYRRARLLHQAAKFVVEKGLPKPKANDWQLVPGIGPYTAGAVTSIAFGIPEPLVDGNVMRVYSRFSADPSLGKLEQNAWLWAEQNLNRDHPGDWNQALMELGAVICTPKGPRCDSCPLSAECIAFANYTPTDFPKPKPKVCILHLEETTVIPQYKNLFGVIQIPKHKWWAELWEFPRFERADQADVVAEYGPSVRYLGTVGYSVTKHRIRMTVYTVRYSEPVPGLRWETRSGLEALAMPAPQSKAFRLLSSAQGFLDY